MRVFMVLVGGFILFCGCTVGPWVEMGDAPIRVPPGYDIYVCMHEVCCIECGGEGFEVARDEKRGTVLYECEYGHRWWIYEWEIE